jgi:protein gp37
MAQTKIEWTATPRPDGTFAPGYTFNPWLGCTKVSPGCAHCYAEAMMDTHYRKVKWGPTGERKRTSPEYWKQPLKWQRAAEAAGERRKVFCGSLCDVFEENIEVLMWRYELMELPAQTPNLDWLFLTKRPENIRGFVPIGWLWGDRFPRNVWVGTSVENKAMADQRIPYLLKIPAPVRFLSCEPLLGPIELPSDWLDPADTLNWDDTVNWVIVGGESGREARNSQVEWIEELRDQCAAAGVPCFVKQLGSNAYAHDEAMGASAYLDGICHPKGGDPNEWPEGLRVRQWPKSPCEAVA